MSESGAGSAVNIIKGVLTKPTAANWPLMVTGLITAIVLLIFGKYLRWDALDLSVGVTQLADRLAPLALAAAVVERAVEILISPWRDAGASKLQKAITAIQARSPDPATSAQNATELEAASNALDEYRGATQKYAFAVSLIIGMLLSVSGVRALGPFADLNKFSARAAAHQHIFFLCTDVFVSATLLAGGAAGLHSVVNAVTTFFDATADKAGN